MSFVPDPQDTNPNAEPPQDIFENDTRLSEVCREYLQWYERWRQAHYYRNDDSDRPTVSKVTEKFKLRNEEEAVEVIDFAHHHYAEWEHDRLRASNPTFINHNGQEQPRYEPDGFVL